MTAASYSINAGIGVWSAGSAPVISQKPRPIRPGDGIALELGATGTIEANEIFGNAHSGIHVGRAGSAPLIRGNSIHDGHGFGVWVKDGTKESIEDNEIFGNKGSGRWSPADRRRQ